MRQEEDDRWDHFVEELQQEILAREEALYSAKVRELARNPQHMGRLAAADAQAVVTGWCGDTMEIYLRFNGSSVREVTFMTDGCAPSVACGSMLATMVQGRPLAEAEGIMPEDLLAALGGLPEDSVHCAELAVTTLRQAIAGWKEEAGGDRSGV
ncbi:MAG: iron-sulfur cluster assembly scaffold protein [Anaerolineae bacterium]